MNAATNQTIDLEKHMDTLCHQKYEHCAEIFQNFLICFADEIFMGTKGKSTEYVLSSKLKQRYKEPKQIYLLHVPIIPFFSSLILRQNKTREGNRKKWKRLEEDPRHTYTRLVNEKEKRI